MTLPVPRLPFSLDPLMAEAKRRARQRRMLIALAILLAGLAVGLTLAFRSPGGRSPEGEGLNSLNHSNGQSGASGPLAVTTGMTAKAVRAMAGRPLRILRGNPRNPDCWVYVVKRNGLADQLGICFKHNRVDNIGFGGSP
jgi:hypothetical protein